jgi:hypothetical protein
MNKRLIPITITWSDGTELSILYDGRILLPYETDFEEEQIFTDNKRNIIVFDMDYWSSIH